MAESGRLEDSLALAEALARAAEAKLASEVTVLDYLDAVLHVFTGDSRTTYDLEDLWYEAPRVEVASGTEGEEKAVS